MLGTPELILILVVVLLLFGPDKLPELARSLGKSVKEFKNAQMEVISGTNNLKEIQTKEHQEGRDKKIHKLATEMGIDTKDKTIEQLVEKIRAKVVSQDKR
jgi:sec-independent protein translocase protein TatA